MSTVSKEKCTSFIFIPQILKEIGHIQHRKIDNKELRSIQYLGHLENILNILKHQSFNNGANKNQAINIFDFEQI